MGFSEDGLAPTEPVVIMGCRSVSIVELGGEADVGIVGIGEVCLHGSETLGGISN